MHHTRHALDAHDPAPAAVSRRAARGVVFLGGGRLIAQGLNALGILILARLLSPAEFGLFALVTFYASLLAAFGDASLGVSLVREPREPSAELYRVVFSVQFLIVMGVGGAFAAAAPAFVDWYGLHDNLTTVLYLVTLAYALTAFQRIPVVHMERRLRFEALGAVELARAAAFIGVLLALVMTGHGIMSFALAEVASSALGVCMVNWLSPWRPRWHWDLALALPHLRFGLAFQGIHFVTVLRQSMTPVLIGLLLGTAAIGYVDWSLRVAGFSLIALMALERLLIPTFARLQGNRAALRHFAELVVWSANAVVAPLALLSLVLIEPITRFVFGTQWLAALPIFYWLLLGNVVVPTTVTLTNLLHALGHPRIGLAFTTGWALATWVIGFPLVWWFGVLGFAVATTCVHLTGIFLWHIARAHLPISLLPQIAPPWVLGALMALVIGGLDHLRPATGFGDLLAYTGLGVVLYAAAVRLLQAGKLAAMLHALGGEGSPRPDPRNEHHAS